MKTPKLFSQDSQIVTLGIDLTKYVEKDVAGSLEVGTMVFLPITWVHRTAENLRSFQIKDDKIEHLTATLHPDIGMESSTQNQKSAIKVFVDEGKVFNLDGGHRWKILSDDQIRLINRIVGEYDKSVHTKEQYAQLCEEARLSAPVIFIRCEVVEKPVDIIKEQFLSNISIKSKAGDIAEYIKNRLLKEESSEQIAADLKFTDSKKIFELVKITRLPQEVIDKVNEGVLPVTSAILIADEYAHNKALRSEVELNAFVSDVVDEKLPIAEVKVKLVKVRDSHKISKALVTSETLESKKLSFTPEKKFDSARCEAMYGSYETKQKLGDIAPDNETWKVLQYIFSLDNETVDKARKAFNESIDKQIKTLKEKEEKKEAALLEKAQKATDKGVSLDTGETL